MTKEINYEDKILVLVGGQMIDVSAADAEYLVKDSSDDYRLVDDRIYQRPRKTNPFNNPPNNLGVDKEIYTWWHKHQH